MRQFFSYNNDSTCCEEDENGGHLKRVMMVTAEMLTFSGMICGKSNGLTFHETHAQAT